METSFKNSVKFSPNYRRIATHENYRYWHRVGTSLAMLLSQRHEVVMLETSEGGMRLVNEKIFG